MCTRELLQQLGLSFINSHTKMKETTMFSINTSLWHNKPSTNDPLLIIPLFSKPLRRSL